MVDVIADHEVVDNEGSTKVETGTASTTVAAVPAVADKVISGFAIDNIGTNDILISMDGGSTFKTVNKKAFFSWNVKGNIKQLFVKTLTGTSDYEIVINYEVF